jgi:hypothetical protein
VLLIWYHICEGISWREKKGYDDGVSSYLLNICCDKITSIKYMNEEIQNFPTIPLIFLGCQYGVHLPVTHITFCKMKHMLLMLVEERKRNWTGGVFLEWLGGVDECDGECECEFGDGWMDAGVEFDKGRD